MPVNGPQADGNVRQRFPVSPDLQASVRESDWRAIWSGRTRVETHTARDSFPAVDHFSGSSTLVASQSCNRTWAAAPEGLFGGLLWKVLLTFTVFRWRICLTLVDSLALHSRPLWELVQFQQNQSRIPQKHEHFFFQIDFCYGCVDLFVSDSGEAKLAHLAGNLKRILLIILKLEGSWRAFSCFSEENNTVAGWGVFQAEAVFYFAHTWLTSADASCVILSEKHFHLVMIPLLQQRVNSIYSALSLIIEHQICS